METGAGAQTAGGEDVIRLINILCCRLLGRRCSAVRPASRDLINGMQSHAAQAEARSVEIRRRREDIAAAFGRGQRYE